MVATETHFVVSGFLLVISASAVGGLRWSLTQLLMRDKKLGIDSPAATIFWLAPVMGITIGLISLVLDSWSSLPGSQFFDGVGATFRTLFFLTIPGVVAFAMVMSEYTLVLSNAKCSDAGLTDLILESSSGLAWCHCQSPALRRRSRRFHYRPQYSATS